MNAKWIIRVVNIVNVALFVATLVVIIWNYFGMSDTIAIHFDIDGNPNRYGHKSSVFVIYGIGLATFFLCYFFQKHPQLSNLPLPHGKDGLPIRATKGKCRQIMDFNSYIISILLFLFFFVQSQFTFRLKKSRTLSWWQCFRHFRRHRRYIATIR